MIAYMLTQHGTYIKTLPLVTLQNIQLQMTQSAEMYYYYYSTSPNVSIYCSLNLKPSLQIGINFACLSC